jgi:hypothetical protein
MPLEPTPPLEREHRKSSSNDRYCFRLWAVVTALWTAATLLRVARVWVPIEGWRSVVGGPWLWLALLLPPLMFGIVIAAVCQLARSQRNFRVVLPRCRRPP